MNANDYFKKGNSYKCITDTLADKGFFLNSIYPATDDGVLINNLRKYQMWNSEICSFELIKKEEIKEDKVNHPKHYTEGPKIILDKDYKAGETITIECIDVIRNMPAWKANVIKYLWREGKKKEDGYSLDKKAEEDILKAQWYLNNKIEELNLIKKYKK